MASHTPGEWVLPAALAPHRERLLATERPIVRLLPQYDDTSPQASLLDSRIGGVPYLPEGLAYPTNHKYEPLQLLCQLDLSTLPPVLPLPERGLLQFFIDPWSFLYGMQLGKDDKMGHEVRYFAEPTAARPVEEVRLKMPDFGAAAYVGPMEAAVAAQGIPVTFEAAQQLAGSSDAHFSRRLGEDFWEQLPDDDFKTREAYDRSNFDNGHHLGGYATFTQGDPRYTQSGDLTYHLLQLDSDDRLGLMWGDMGIAHFFISRKALEAGQFEKATFYWDCY